ncbi:hypothetical protein ANCCAN_26165 [Ancylostoma caninum]|uniref:Uncharacterized protein n=1 Tax=Ancylostoma caninum TaxID=29170 RepID=A0A368FD27_ANCCA|nr:hypothetical protein ANCCAN_26165 [Ancylostoma caninum]
MQGNTARPYCRHSTLGTFSNCTTCISSQRFPCRALDSSSRRYRTQERTLSICCCFPTTKFR